MVSSTRDMDVRYTKNIHGWNPPKTQGHFITSIPKKFYNCKQTKHSYCFKVKYMACGLIYVLQTNTNDNKLDILHPMENNYFEKIYSQ